MTRKLELSYSANTREIEKALKTVHDGHTSFGDVVKRVGKVAIASFAAVAAGVTAAGVTVARQGLQMNAQLETATKQFRSLGIQGAGEAEKHVKSLFKFAAQTPFETGPIIEASKNLQLFGRAALNTRENLRLVGDAAAASGQEINEVAFWIGRAYSAMEAGKPFGEAAARLQEMGILSATARTKLEDLQAEGAKGPAIWKALQDELGRTTGAMADQANTWIGIRSTIADTFSMTAQRMTEPLFEALKVSGQGFIAFANGPFWGQIEAQGKRIFGGLAKAITTFSEQFTHMTQAQGIDPGAAFGMAFKESMKELRAQMRPLLEGLFDALAEIDLAEKFIRVLDAIDWQKLLEGMINGMATTLEKIDLGPIIIGIIKLSDNVVMALIEGIISAFSKDPWAMIGALIGIFLAPAKWVDAIIDGLRKIPIVGPIIGWLVGSVKSALDWALKPIKDFFKGHFDEALKGVKSSVAGFFDDAGKWLLDSGRRVMEGLIDGIKAGGRLFKQVWNAIIEAIPGDFANFLKIGSPSKVFEMFGQNLMQGLTRGIEGSSMTVQKALGDVALKTQTVFEVSSTGVTRPTERWGDLGGLVAAIERLAARPITVTMEIDGRGVAAAIAGPMRDELYLQFGQYGQSIFAGKA